MVSFYGKYKKHILFFSVAFLVVVLDQVSKTLIKNFLKEPAIVIPNFLSLVYAQNTGAGFGLLQGFNWLLILVSVIIIAFVFYHYKKIRVSQKLLFYPTALLLGGAVGNLIDRLAHGFVVDFVSFSFWPAFNLADSALTLAVIGLIFYFWKKK